MKIEHVAFNVAAPVEMAAWYVQHLGMSIARKVDGAPYTHFLADDGGSVMIEIYNNPTNEVPDYAAMNPLMLHLAFVSVDPAAEKTRLELAGASLFDDVGLEDGSHLVTMRDPWGLAIQLCKRGKPMLEV
ncbi:MAG: VOC family protein [Pyrinomonadaceae bacterium]